MTTQKLIQLRRKTFNCILLLTLFIASFLQAKAQTTLSPGDIAIIGTNYDAFPYEMTIVNLAPISAGTVVRITDYGYDENTGTFGTTSVSNTSEGAITWTLTSTMAAGTVTKFSIAGGATPAVTGLPGTVSVTGWSNISATSCPVPAGGDNWIIFQGSSPTSISNFVFAWVNTFAATFNAINQPAGQFIVSGSGAPNNQNSYLPPYLTLGSTAIALNRDPSNGGYHGDNNVYKGTTNGTKSSLLAAIGNVANWITNETTSYDIAPSGTNFPGTNPIFAVSVPCAISLTAASKTNVACNGGSTGTATVNAATGGTAPYTYNWTPGTPTGDGTASVSGLTAGTWTCTVTDANSCTKSLDFIITQPNPIIGTANLSICQGDSIKVGNTYFKTSGQHIKTLQAKNGCDSVVTLNLNIKTKTASSMTKSVCNSYVFKNMTITQSGIYKDTLVNAAGCDSVVTLNLTIKTKTASSMTKSVCDSYVFNNMTITQSGIYKDTLVNAAGCDSVVTLNLTINYTPSKPYVETPNPVCNEGSFSIVASSLIRLNCRNCGDNNIYLWKNSAGDSVFNDTDFTTPLLTKTETYSVTAELNGCISSPSFVVAEVINIPTPTISTLVPVCSGNSTVISVVPFSNGRIAGCRGCGELFDYTWYNLNGDSIGTSSSYTTPNLLATTKYYVKASDRGCYSDSTEAKVVVISKPNIVQEIYDKKLCVNELAKFKVVADGVNLKYNWGMTNGVNWMVQPSETKDSVEFNVDAELNGMTIFTIVSNVCGMDTSMAMLNVNVVDTAVSVQNGTITANIADQTYQWINVDTKTNIDGATAPTFTPQQTGVYAVVVTQYFGKGAICSDTSGVRYVVVVPTGVESSTVSNFTLFPNPATDNVTVTLTESVTGTVSIVDLHGNVVATKSISGNTSNISTAELASGVYVVKISSDKGVAVKQLVIQ